MNDKKMRKTIHILGTTNQKQSAVNVFLIQFFYWFLKKCKYTIYIYRLPHISPVGQYYFGFQNGII